MYFLLRPQILPHEKLDNIQDFHKNNWKQKTRIEWNCLYFLFLIP